MSSLEPGDRRRFVAAAVTSIAALPFLLGGHGGTAGVAAIGQRASLASALDSSGARASAVAVAAPYEGTGIGFMTGPPPATDPSVVQIVVPTSGPGNVLDGVATFHQFGVEGEGVAQPCAVAGPVIGATVTVVDLDNGRSVFCTVVGLPARSARADIVLSPGAFSQMADLGQAPVHVRITW